MNKIFNLARVAAGCFVLMQGIDASAATETIVLNSGAGLNPNDLVPDIKNIHGSPSVALRNAAFTPQDFLDARSLGQAYVVNPANIGWVSTLSGSGSNARWINWAKEKGDPNREENPASALYAMKFHVDTQNPCVATITFQWAADDQLGDNDTPNVGVYIGHPNGSGLPNPLPVTAITGGGFSAESTISATLDPSTLAGGPGAAGDNWLYVYNRDTLHHFSGVIFHAEIVVSSTEVIHMISGAAGVDSNMPSSITPGGFQPDATYVLGSAGSPLSPTAWATNGTDPVFTQAQNGPHPYVVMPYTGGWVPGFVPTWLSANIASNQQDPGPPGTALYAVQFNVSTPQPACAYLHLCWSTDDTLGDPATGPNPTGVWINGYPVGIYENASDPFMRGGTYTNVTCMDSVDLVGKVHSGINYLYLYNRDTGGGASGVRYNATMTVCCGSCTPPPLDMVAWWPLDEPVGNVAAEIAEGHTGTLASAPVHETGYVSGALHFDGVDDKVEADKACHQWQNLTIDAWIRLDTVPPLGTARPIVGWEENNSNPDDYGVYDFYVETTSSGTFLGQIVCDCDS